MQAQKTVEPQAFLGTKKIYFQIGIIPALYQQNNCHNVTCSWRLETWNRLYYESSIYEFKICSYLIIYYIYYIYYLV